MARYRKPDMDMAYGDVPPDRERWDTDRFQRESQQRRQAPVIEQRPPYESARRAPAYYEDDRYYRDDYESGPRGTRERKFFEEDQYYDPRASQGAMVPFRPEQPARPARPPRPGMIRRQSSVDRFDFERRRDRRYDDDYYRPPPPPPRQGGRSSHYDIKIYDDVKVQDPDQYGDDGFREYREREWTRSRARNDSPSPGRRAPSTVAKSEFIDATFEEKVEEKVVDKPYPRRGKTRMPKRLVNTKVLFDLGYPFYEEDEKTILIEKALGPDNIDEVFARSKEYREREVITTRLIEAPIPSAPSTKPISEAPRSVREWDNFAALERSPSPGSSISQSTRKSRRRARSQAPSRKSFHETIHEDVHRSRHGDSVHESIHESIHRGASRSPSPAPTYKSRKSKARSRATSRSRRRSVSSERSGTTIIERKVIERDNFEESGTVDLNFPLALTQIPDRSKSRTDAEIRAEIRRLEHERKDLRRDTETIRYDRRSRRDSSPIGILREPSPRGEIIVADRRDDEMVAVRKDKRDRARSKSRPPSTGLLKSMMYAVT